MQSDESQTNFDSDENNSMMRRFLNGLASVVQVFTVPCVPNAGSSFSVYSLVSSKDDISNSIVHHRNEDLSDDEELEITYEDAIGIAECEDVDSENEEFLDAASEYDQQNINCFWHDEIQKCVERTDDLLSKHESHEFSEDQIELSENWNRKFIAGCKKGKPIWEKMKTFCCKPSMFRMKEIQMYVEDDIKQKYPEEELKEKIDFIISSIEEKIREDLMRKSEEEKKITERLKKINVKGYLSGDKDKYLSDKAEFLVVDEISKIMLGKPGLLKRGLQNDKRRYEHLKPLLGDITPNCSDKNCSHTAECYHMESDIVLLYPSMNKINIVIIEVKRPQGKKDNRMQAECLEIYGH